MVMEATACLVMVLLDQAVFYLSLRVVLYVCAGVDGERGGAQV